MIPPFEILDVTDWKPYRDEPMGSKTKLWLVKDNVRWLFKERRKDHGEDWAEKIACEIAAVLGVPHAHVELAVRGGVPGVVSRDFLDDPHVFQLIHGNELLVNQDPLYPAKGKNFGITQHTLDRVLHVLRQDFIHLGYDANRPAAISCAPEQFVGYLMLDALIGNTDRHHENWAIIVRQPSPNVGLEAELAPTFDHASCLGRECTEQDRQRRLSGSPNQPTLDAYLRKMPSRIYRDQGDKRPLHPIAAFRLAGKSYPAAARAWVEQLARMTDDLGRDMTDAVPSARISPLGRQFASKMLSLNRESLLKESF